jgi:desulfoferrodoxin (superoxide reductase-like protein)
MKNAMFFLLFFSVASLVAHAPKGMDLNYNAEAAALTVTVHHKVSDAERHYIRRIEVFAGKELLAEKTYERQETTAVQEEMFLFIDKPLARGTVVTVTAYCNLSGKRSARLEWE